MNAAPADAGTRRRSVPTSPKAPFAQVRGAMNGARRDLRRVPASAGAAFICGPLLALLVVVAMLAGRGAAGQIVAPVAPADLSRLTPADFRDDELDIPYYLANFHRLANSVALSGERRGFIDIVVWRNQVD